VEVAAVLLLQLVQVDQVVVLTVHHLTLQEEWVVETQVVEEEETVLLMV